MSTREFDGRYTAEVVRITATTKGAGCTPVDLVGVVWQGRAYQWETPPGVYSVGQEVAIVPPVSAGLPVEPAQRPWETNGE